MSLERPGPVNGETSGRVAGQDMRLAHDSEQRPDQRARKRITRSVSLANWLRDKVIGLTATVRLNTERARSATGGRTAMGNGLASASPGP